MTVSTGLVKPAFRTSPPYAKTLGPVVADIAELAGYGPDAEQREALDLIFGMTDDNKVASLECAVIACRQNLKTALFKMCALGWLFVTDQRLIVWSAHEFSTAQEAHRDLAGLIEGCPQLRRRLKSVHHGAADKSIEMLSGQRVMFKARTHTGSRGLSGDKIVLDEAFALQATHVGALFPTLSARPDPQLVYGSSAGLLQSAVLRAIRDRGRVGDGRLAYLEFTDDLGGDCASSACDHSLMQVGCRLDDERRWFRANPALGRRISLDYVRAERRGMPPLEFARERLGWWEDPEDEFGSPIPADVWSGLVDVASRPVAPVAFALAVAEDQSWSAIAVAGAREDGSRQVALVDNRPGTAWVADRLVQLAEDWRSVGVALDPASQAGSLLTTLLERGVKVVQVTGRELAQACGGFLNAVLEGTMRHHDDAPLNGAVRLARTRPASEAWVFSQRNSASDISPLMAATLALHLHAATSQSRYDITLSVY